MTERAPKWYICHCERASLVYYYQLNSTLYLNSTHFRPPLRSFSVFGCTLHLVATPISFLSNSFSDFSCFWEPRQFWGRLVRYFVHCPSVWIYLTFSSCLDSGYLFLEEEHRGEVQFPSHHVKYTGYHHDWWCYPWSPAEEMWPAFSRVQFFLLSPFSALYSLEGSQWVCRYSPHSRVGGALTPYPWKENISIRYSEFVCERDLSLLP